MTFNPAPIASKVPDGCVCTAIQGTVMTFNPIPPHPTPIASKVPDGCVCTAIQGIVMTFNPTPTASKVPDGCVCTAIQGMVEELVVNDDPEHQWIDKIRSMRSSNEARQVQFSKLSG